MTDLAAITPDIFSAYLFFPFAFDNSTIELKELVHHLQSDPLKRWKASDYEIKKGKDYNEFLYFYPYVRDILFSTSRTIPRDFYFLSWHQEDLTFKVFASKPDPLFAKIKGIYLHLYEFGVGVLIFELHKEHPTYTLKEWIQFLNLARRLYPSFVHKDLDFVEVQRELISAIQIEECPSKIQIYENNMLMVEHDYIQDNKWAITEPHRQIPTLSKIITHLLDINHSGYHFTYTDGHYRSIVDDRMFVHSFYRLPLEGFWENKIFVEELQQYFNLSDKEKFDHKALNYWYQLVFVDSDSPSCPNIPLKKELIKKATYTRWIRPLNDEYPPTFYGFSRFSSVMLVTTKEPDNPDDFSYVLHSHFNTMYYQIAVLLFFYRGALLNFSRRSAKIVKLFQKGIQKNGKRLLERLQKEFLLFRNRFWFKEVTAQDQGIDMFQKWAEQMNIFELMEDVKSEIQELYEFVKYVNEQKENQLLNWITIIGAVLLPITIVTGFMGMNLFDPNHAPQIHLLDFAHGWLWFWVPLLSLYLIILVIILIHKLKRE